MAHAESDEVKRELTDWLGAKRRHVRSQVEAIPEADRRRSQVPSGWTPVGAIHHLTLDVERVWFRAVMAGDPVDLPSGYDGWLAAEHLTDREILARYEEECALADEVIARLDLEARPAWWFEGAGDPPYSTLREVILHVLVETATHAGHLDIVRELVDGGQRLVLDTPE